MKSRLRKGSYDEVINPLDDITHLFVAPDFDPFAAQAIYVSGIDLLITALRSKTLRKKTRVILLLPPDQISAGLEPKLQQAMNRYCAFKIQGDKSELASTLWQGTKALQSGVVFLAVCLTLAALIDQPSVLPTYLTTILSEGLTIVGWVSLWRPVELLLYEWWPTWRDRQIYQHITRADLVIRSQD